jgi:hypothetical protein
MPEHYTAKEWEHLRKRFLGSILNDTTVAVLGQNAGISWPLRGSDDTPNKYIEYTFEELQQVPGLIGKNKRVHQLMDILRETLAFDDPFSDMVDTVEAESKQDDTFERILARYNIPANYPAEFIDFCPETRALIKGEDLKTLIEVIRFGQNLAQNVIVGGDLKTFLNGIAQEDGPSMMKHLPYRAADRGLYLAEAIGLIARSLDVRVQLELLAQSGLALTVEEEATRHASGQLITEAELQPAVARVAAVCEWFTQEAADLELVFTAGGSPERYFTPINNPRHERIALMLTRAHFGISSQEARKGFMDKLSGLFGR